jgi:hypothetical protein
MGRSGKAGEIRMIFGDLLSSPMDTTVAQFEVSSPDELREALTKLPAESKARFAAVRVFGPEVITRHFELPQMSALDLVSGLKLEANQIFSAKANNDIELSYQILSVDNGHVKGVFTAMLRKRLLDYLACFRESRLVPVSLTSTAVGAVGDFVKKNPAAGRDYFLVNFVTAQAVDVIVVMDGEPALFREINEPSDAEIEKKVVDCVRYCCSHSVSKHLEAVFFMGDLTGKEFLMQRLKGLIYPNPSQEEMAWTPWQIDMEKLNLCSGYALGEGERRVFESVLTMFVIGAFLMAALVGWKVHLTRARVIQARSSFSAADHKLALDLQERIKKFEYEQ